MGVPDGLVVLWHLFTADRLNSAPCDDWTRTKWYFPRCYWLPYAFPSPLNRNRLTRPQSESLTSRSENVHLHLTDTRLCDSSELHLIIPSSPTSGPRGHVTPPPPGTHCSRSNQYPTT